MYNRIDGVNVLFLDYTNLDETLQNKTVAVKELLYEIGV